MSQVVSDMDTNATFTFNISMNDSSTDFFMDGGYYHKYVVIEMVFALFVFPVGVLGNLLTIFILTRKSNRQSSTAVFITALAISDNGILFTGSIFHWLKSVNDLVPYGDIECSMLMFVNISCLQISSWLLSIISIERAVCVVFPHKARDLFNISSSKVIVAITIISFVLLNSVCLFGNEISEADNIKCQPKPWALYYFENIFPWIDFVLSFLLPFIIILTCSLILGSYLLKWRTPGSGRQKDNTSIMVTLLLVNFTFILTMSPFCIYQIIDPLAVDGEAFGLSRFLSYLFLQISEINPMLNFYLYFLSSTKFRTELRSLFVECRSTYGSGVFSWRK